MNNVVKNRDLILSKLKHDISYYYNFNFFLFW